MNNIYFNAHHSPIGSFASFTLGFRGASGGMGLELGKPADQNVYIGLERPEGGVFDALPFFAGSDVDERSRYEQGQPDDTQAGRGSQIVPFSNDVIGREFCVATDTWIAGDLAFTVYSQVQGIPDPDTVAYEELKTVLLPAVLAELTVDNSTGKQPRRAYFGYSGSDPYSAMRRIDDTLPGYAGIGQGRATAIVTDDPGAVSGLGFNLADILDADPPENRTFGLGANGALVLTIPAGQKKTFRFALCFYRGGIATSGLDTKYLYTTLFHDIEHVARYALSNFETLASRAREADRKILASRLSDDQQFMLTHAIRSYYGSTQLLLDKDDEDPRPPALGRE